MHTYVISYDAFDGYGDFELEAHSRREVENECRSILEELGGGCASVFNSDGDKWLFDIEV